jgi:hypothetical protein
MDRDEFLKYIVEKIEKLHDEIVKIRETQSAQHETLKDHTRRSESNEAAVVLLRTEYEGDKNALERTLKEKFAPIDNHIKFVDAALKILGGVGVVIAATVGIIEIIKFIQS